MGQHPLTHDPWHRPIAYTLFCRPTQLCYQHLVELSSCDYIRLLQEYIVNMVNHMALVDSKHLCVIYIVRTAKWQSCMQLAATSSRAHAVW